MKDTEFEIYHGDTLTNDWDFLRETNPAKKPTFDAVVANPPFSYRRDPGDSGGAMAEDMRFKVMAWRPRPDSPLKSSGEQADVEHTEPMMPKRSNDFQALIHRLESALHPHGARVEESAMVHNHATGKREEIDVVVTFALGGRTYRTGVAVRDQSRKAGPGWIRDLSKQRENCRLDRMAAVHSQGFTDGAIRQAAAEGIELLGIQQVGDELLLRIAPAFTADLVTAMPLRYVMTFATPQKEQNLSLHWTAHLPDGRKVQVRELWRLIEQPLKARLRPELKPQKTLPDVEDKTLVVKASVQVHPDFRVTLGDGRTTQVLAMRIDAVARRVVALLQAGPIGSYQATPFRDAKGETAVGKASATITRRPSGNLEGIVKLEVSLEPECELVQVPDLYVPGISGP